MAYCPYCRGNFPINVVTESKDFMLGSALVNVPRCSNCNKLLWLTDATSAEVFDELAKSEFHRLKDERLLSIRDEIEKHNKKPGVFADSDTKKRYKEFITEKLPIYNAAADLLSKLEYTVDNYIILTECMRLSIYNRESFSIILLKRLNKI